MMIRRLLHNQVALSIGLFGAIALFGDASRVAAQAVQTGSLAVTFRPTKTLPVSDQLLAIGKKTYNKECAPCHGVDGRGQGETAYLLYPKPRDFLTAQYRLVSTWERQLTDIDLYTSISRGIPGSTMPSWAHLPEETRWGLVHYIKSFAENPIQPNTAESESGTGIIKVPPEPPYTAEAATRAQEFFLDACASCHGEKGKGDGVQEQFDDAGYPTRPRDLTVGVFKGIPEPLEVYRRIVAGLPGTPMPMSDWAYGTDAWDLTHFILSMSSPEQRERVEMKKFLIVVKRVAQIPDHPDASVWRDAPSVNLHMMPLWWRNDRPEILTVQAVHDGKELALRLMWYDDTNDKTAMRVQDFRDAAAVSFTLDPDPPFFGMGEKGRFVNIWMWKAERQADMEAAFQDLDKVYPNIGIDSYPNLMRSALEQPTRHALTMESDPTFITGWGAGNIVSDPTRESTAEALYARGFCTLKAHPIPDQTVTAKGAHDIGTYRVIFRRAFKGSVSNVKTGSASAKISTLDFVPGQTVRVAFAVWNGHAGDRDGKKSVTIWQDLVIAK
ncbi:MAG: ethylbenzene dehydrogenase-related protein [candidate division KSB1 bacterium]|nr:ethylbenzene dehydrogenase-related protein [candidate division KSB1 bacterium]MDZ7366991.1 ethylbenzene dehydrogenase-related protein [candidate division KSB1 bacterium]MDZ7406804.1 ethylbenzene dehydrogenase-related protein [candidate division KSB1 bacterium]